MLPRTVAVAVFLAGCAHSAPRKDSAVAAAPAPSPPPVEAPAAPRPDPAVRPVEFARDVRPLLESRCQPCHFAGGRMYERLPFDRPDTIRQLGTKLFTRIKDEASQATIRQFLEQGQ
jgi:hypothetical protein